jgi:hypothetical protein
VRPASLVMLPGTAWFFPSSFWLIWEPWETFDQSMEVQSCVQCQGKAAGSLVNHLGGRLRPGLESKGKEGQECRKERPEPLWQCRGCMLGKVMERRRPRASPEGFWVEEQDRGTRFELLKWLWGF